MDLLIIVGAILGLVYLSRRSTLKQKEKQSIARQLAETAQPNQNSRAQQLYELATPEEKRAIERFAELNGLPIPKAHSHDRSGEAVTDSYHRSDGLATATKSQNQAGSKAIGYSVAAGSPRSSVPAIASANYLLFFGALLITASLLFFARSAYDTFGPGVRFLMLSAVVAAFYGAGRYLYGSRPSLRPAAATFLGIAMFGAIVVASVLYNDVFNATSADIAWLLGSFVLLAMVVDMWWFSGVGLLPYVGAAVGLSTVLSAQASVGFPVWTFSTVAVLYGAAALWWSGRGGKNYVYLSGFSNAVVASSVASGFFWPINEPQLSFGITALAASVYYVLLARQARTKKGRVLSGAASYTLAVLGVHALLELNVPALASAVLGVSSILGAWVYCKAKASSEFDGSYNSWLVAATALLAGGLMLSSEYDLALLISAVALAGWAAAQLAYRQDEYTLLISGGLGVVTALLGLEYWGSFQAVPIAGTLFSLGALWTAVQLRIKKSEELYVAEFFGMGLSALAFLQLLQNYPGWAGIVLGAWSLLTALVAWLRERQWLLITSVVGMYLWVLLAAPVWFPQASYAGFWAGALTVTLALLWQRRSADYSKLRMITAVVAFTISFFDLFIPSTESPWVLIIGWLLLAVGLIMFWRSSEGSLFGGVHPVGAALAYGSAVSVILAVVSASRLFDNATGLLAARNSYLAVGAGTVWLAGCVRYFQAPRNGIVITERFSTYWRQVALVLGLLAALSGGYSVGRAGAYWSVLFVVFAFAVWLEGRIVDRYHLRYGGSMLVVAGAMLMMRALEIKNIHAYTHLLAVYFLGLSAVLWRYRRDKHASDQAIIFGLLCAYVPLALAALNAGETQGQLLLLESVVGLAFGAVIKNKGALIVSSATLGLTVLYRVSAYFAQIPTWVWYFGLGAALIALAVWIIQKQKP